MATKVVDVRNGQRKIENLPPMTKVVHINYVDKYTNLNYGGDFTLKRLNLGDLQRVGIRRAELNGGMPEDSLNPSIRHMNAMLAHLEIAIIKAPEWWKPLEFYTGDIISDVYEEVMKFEDSFRNPVREGEQTTQADSSVAPGQRGSSSSPMVDEEVSTSANL